VDGAAGVRCGESRDRASPVHERKHAFRSGWSRRRKTAGGNTMKSAVVLLPIIASVINGPLAAQWANYPTPRIPRTADGKPNLTAPTPRTRDGKPDLSGLWDKISPKYGRNIAADLKPGEVQPW